MKEAESKYIGYHSHIKSMRPTSIPESERVSLDQNIAMFITNCASEVHEFGTHIEQTYGDHHREIVKSLIEELNGLNILSRSMQRKASKYGRIRPSRLFASSSKQAKILNSLTSDYQQDSDSKNKANAARSKELGERYSNEVASV